VSEHVATLSKDQTVIPINNCVDGDHMLMPDTIKKTTRLIRNSRQVR